MRGVVNAGNFKCLHDDEYHRKDGEGLFTRAGDNSKGGMASNRMRVGLDMRKKFFIVRVVRH